MKLETILKIPNNSKKKRLLFNYIMTEILPKPNNWKVVEEKHDKTKFS